MFESIRRYAARCARVGLLSLTLLGCALPVATPVLAAQLSLVEAEIIALDQDPSLRALSAERSALQDRAVAAGQLPDPMLKAGFVGLPTDTWNLGQEPMTQAQVGLVQKFPRGRSRALRTEQLLEQSDSLEAMIRDQHLQLLRTVREEYLEVAKQVRLAEINAEALSAFGELADITSDYYATGRAQQQDVLRTSVELARVEDRATRIQMDEERARARLGALIGEAAYRDLDENWPQTALPRARGDVEEWLLTHPRIEALEEQVAMADTAIELAEQQYRPEFSLDVTYGGRGGAHPDGRHRPDLLSVMLVMDVPLFRGNRQDRHKSAAVYQSSAATYRRDDALRRMQSEARMLMATLHRQHERLQRFEDRLLPDARDNAEAAFSAYQAALGDLTALMRARITEFDLRLEYVALRAEMFKTGVRLKYLQGESS